MYCPAKRTTMFKPPHVTSTSLSSKLRWTFFFFSVQLQWTFWQLIKSTVSQALTGDNKEMSWHDGSTPWLCLLIVVLQFLERSLADRVISVSSNDFVPRKAESSVHHMTKANIINCIHMVLTEHTEGAQSNHQVFSSSTQKVELISVPLIGITATPPV